MADDKFTSITHGRGGNGQVYHGLKIIWIFALIKIMWQMVPSIYHKTDSVSLHRHMVDGLHQLSYSIK